MSLDEQQTSRLVTISFLLLLLLLLFGVELLGIRWDHVFSTDASTTRWSIPALSNTPRQRWISTLARQFIAPIIVSLFAIYAISNSFSRLGRLAAAEATQQISPEFNRFGYLCNATNVEHGVDADIAGDGIRITIWVQIGFLIVIAVLGTFHCKATGAKELGAGLAVTHFSLVVALLVQHGRGTLTAADAIIGAMILDAQNSALSIQLATKETLAARWQVGIIIACQLTGLAVILFLVEAFRTGSLDDSFPHYTQCDQCLTVFWWAFLRNCPTSATRPEETTEEGFFWIYYACRCITSLQSAFLAAANTWQFHLAERDNRALNNITFPHMSGRRPIRGNNQDDEEELSMLISTPRYWRRPPPDGPVGSNLHYAGYPSTVTIMYVIYGIFALTSMATAEISMRNNTLRPSSEIFSVGQITGIVVAGATSIRAAWLFLRMFILGNDGKLKFLWPFSFDWLGALYSPTFMVYPLGTRELSGFPVQSRGNTEVLRLGDILVFSGKGIDRPVSILRLGDRARIPDLQHSEYEEVIRDALVHVRGLGDFSTDELEVRYLFTDSENIVQSLVKETKPTPFSLPAEVIPTKKQKDGSRFLVTGLMLARRPRVRDTSAWPIQTSARSTVLFAYQLRSLGRSGKASLVYNGAKVAEWSILEDEVGAPLRGY